MIEQNFCEMVRTEVLKNLGPEYKASVHAVVKNNNVKLDSLIIQKEGAVVMPSIYLNSFYEEYKNGRELDNIVTEILEIYMANNHQEFLGLQFEYEQIRDTIFYRLVNMKRNEESLKTMPFIPVGEFAVIFHCMLLSEHNRLGSVKIVNSHLAMWNITEEELIAQACRNTRQILPTTIRPMEEVLDDIMSQGIRDTKDKEDMEQLLQRKERETIPMYVLSNEKASYGAGAVLDVEEMDRFIEEIGEDCYLLPSSVHEIILVPVSKAPDPERMNQMVEDINATQVPEQEFLSDTVMRYSEFRELLPLCFFEGAESRQVLFEHTQDYGAELQHTEEAKREPSRG